MNKLRKSFGSSEELADLAEIHIVLSASFNIYGIQFFSTFVWHYKTCLFPRIIFLMLFSEQRLLNWEASSQPFQISTKSEFKLICITDAMLRCCWRCDNFIMLRWLILNQRYFSENMFNRMDKKKSKCE